MLGELFLRGGGGRYASDTPADFNGYQGNTAIVSDDSRGLFEYGPSLNGFNVDPCTNYHRPGAFIDGGGISGPVMQVLSTNSVLFAGVHLLLTLAQYVRPAPSYLPIDRSLHQHL